MKLTKESLKRIIKEELKAVLNEDAMSNLKDRRAAEEEEFFRDRAQKSRISDNERFVGAHMAGTKNLKLVYDRNKDEIYDMVIKQIASYDRVKTTIGKGKVTKDAVHYLINDAIKHAGGVRVGELNITYLNELIHRAAQEEINDLVKHLEGQQLQNRVNKMIKGEDNSWIAQHIIKYINPLVTSYLDDTRGFMDKTSSFFRGKGFREE